MSAERKAPPKAREFRAWARFKEDEAIWPAQVVTWLPVVSELVAIFAVLFTIMTSAALRGHLTTAAISLVVLLIIATLYGLAATWIGQRQRRGILLATALFAWSLVGSVLSRHLISLGAAYDVLALILVIRAGRAIGMPWTGRFLPP